MIKLNISAFLSTTLIILFGIYKLYTVIKISTPPQKYSELTDLVAEGLAVFIKRVVSSTLQLILYSSIVFYLFARFTHTYFSWVQMLSFWVGGILMTLSAVLMAKIATTLVPKIIGCSRTYFVEGLKELYTVSASIGFIIIGMILLGLFVFIGVFGMESCIGYGLGIVFAGFFLRVSGGVYKSGTDIVADTISSIDHNVPHFDRRNPATLLDITGSYIGEIMGFSADIIGSFVFSIISCCLFAYSLFQSGTIDQFSASKLLQLPIFIVSTALLVSIVVYIISMIRMRFRYQNFLLEGVYASALICGVATFFILRFLDIQIPAPNFYPFMAYLLGLVGAVLIGFCSDYLTSTKFSKAKMIAKYAEYGPVITMFNGMSTSLKSMALFVGFILIVSLPSFYFAGYFGIAMASLGMLSVTSTILISSIFKPLSSNTRKLAELSDLDDNTLHNATQMETLGKTTGALGNGFLSAASAVSSFSLFFSLLLISQFNVSEFLHIDIAFLAGMLIGMGLPFVFSGFLVKGLILAIQKTLKEVLRQFREIPYLMEDKARPDMILASNVISICAINALTMPGLLMVIFPVIIGYIFGIKMLSGFVLGGFLSSIFYSYFWSTLGDIFNNARHYIKSGYYGGPQTPSYKSISIVDNIGDAYKDLLSPSLNIFIKAVSMIAVLIFLLLSF